MRPRHKAAENGATRLPRAHRELPASMRPRHKAAENGVRRLVASVVDVNASMRPRHKAAENPCTPGYGRRPPGGFNEAAA